MPTWGAGFVPPEAEEAPARRRGPADAGAVRRRSAGGSPNPVATRCRKHRNRSPIRAARVLAGTSLAIGSHPRRCHPLRLDTAAGAVSRHWPRRQTVHTVFRTDVYVHLSRRPSRARRSWCDPGARQPQTGTGICSARRYGSRLDIPIPGCPAASVRAPARDDSPLPPSGLAVSTGLSTTRRHGDQPATGSTRHGSGLHVPVADDLPAAARVSAAGSVGILHRTTPPLAALPVGSRPDVQRLVWLWGRRCCSGGDGGCGCRPTGCIVTGDCIVHGSRIAGGPGAGPVGQFSAFSVSRQSLGQHASLACRRGV